MTQKKTVRLARRARKAPKAQNSRRGRIWSAFGAMRARIWQGSRRGRDRRDGQQPQNGWDGQDGHPQDGRGGEGLPDLRGQQQEQGACARLAEHGEHVGPQEQGAHGEPRKPCRHRKPRMRRSYLLRLVISCAALLLLPFAAGTAAILTRSFNETRDASHAAYRQAALGFGENWQREISRLYTQAVRISVESATPGKETAVFRLNLLQSSAWYYYEAVQAISHIDADFPYAMGVYFYEDGSLITRDGKYTLDTYLKLYGGTPESRARLEGFFSEGAGGISYCPVYSREGTFEKAYIGASVVFRSRRDPALIFYQISPSAFQASEKIAGAAYAVVN